MANILRARRGTRAGLNTLAGASGLLAGELYLITDEGRFAVGLTPTTYSTFIKQSELIILLASTAGTAGLRIPHGVAPTTPVNGDMWTTTAGLYIHINGTTVGPLSTGGAPGGSSYTVSSQATSFTETATSGEVIRKITASQQTVTLPTAVGNTAKITFKMMVAGTCTIDANGTETIDGGLTAILSSQYEAMTIVSDNANWIVI